MRKKFLVFLCIGLIMCLVSCKKSTTCNGSFYDCYILSKDYDNLIAVDNVYQKITIDEFKTKLENKDDFIVYYGQPNCSFCLKNVAFFDLNAKALNIEIIYYIESDIFNNNDKQADILQALCGFDSDNAPTKAPRLWSFVDGKYYQGMRHFVTSTDVNFNESSKLLMESFLKEVLKEEIVCFKN